MRYATIPLQELKFFPIRSRGPGGQNVNKVNSACLMLWDFQNSRVLDREQKILVQEKLARQINRDGLVYLRCDEYRDLERNKARCHEKLAALLERAFHKPKKRIATRPSRTSKTKRLEKKKRHGILKQSRTKPPRDLD